MNNMLACAFFFGLFTLPVFSISVGIEQNLTVDLAGIDGPVVHRVAVGHQNAPAFSPNRLNANIGDRIIFEFHNHNHTLTQSSLGEPCSPIGALDTGFGQYNPQDRSGITLTITVNSLEPQWFFCKQEQPSPHCHAGMVFALNPGDKMKQFLENAKRGTTESLGIDRRSTASAHSDATQSVVPVISPAATFTAALTESPVGSSISKLVNSPAFSSSASLVRVSLITPVQVITVTQTVSCTQSPSALSVRRSVPVPVSASDGNELATVTPMPLLIVFFAAVLLL
ncbi:hypothetical protein BBP40_007901 [Aspergillus hancockii]|nr:hypothetical protein BBP40_007901 [Aspergillus hancockii]